MEERHSVADIASLIRQLPPEQREALTRGISGGAVQDAREEVLRLIELINGLPASIREAILKGIDG